MNILIVINSVIPALRYGGTQRVMWSLGKELSRRGHEVSFMAKQGSECDFAKVIIRDTEKPLSSQIPSDIDVVHLNEERPDEAMTKPYIVTYHGNRMAKGIDRNAVFVSRNHASRFGSKQYVYNGLDFSDYPPYHDGTPRQGFHFLGKAAWRVKNVRGAIRIATALPHETIDILGGVRFNFRMGWRFTLSPRAKFFGMVDNHKKAIHIQHSRGLIFPVLWDEPFGLAVIESLYYGAPVFGTPFGSLPELVTEEVGFLSRSKSEIIGHIANAYNYSPRRCHDYAATLFNSNRMTDGYLAKYETVMNGLTLNPQDFTTRESFERYKMEK